MTDTVEMIDPVTGEIIDERQPAEQPLVQAREQGVGLVGPGGLLAGLTKTVLEAALEAEMTEHPGRERHGAAEGPNVRNGTRFKTVLTEIGPVEIEVPRDREGTFEPQIVKKRKRRLDGIDEVVLSLSARRLTTVMGQPPYPTLPLQAAALLESTTRNPPLIDGNKRSTWVMAVVFFALNGAGHDMNADEVFDLVVGVAARVAERGAGR